MLPMSANASYELEMHSSSQADALRKKAIRMSDQFAGTAYGRGVCDVWDCRRKGVRNSLSAEHQLESPFLYSCARLWLSGARASWNRNALTWKMLLRVAAAILILPSCAVAAEPADIVGFRLIVVESQRDALDVLAGLKAGKPFDVLAATRSIHPSARTGGFLAASSSELRQEIRAVLTALHPGEVSSIMMVEGHYAVLQLPTLEDAFLAAAQYGETALVRQLMSGPAAPLAPRRVAALVDAAYAGHVDIVRVLLDSGVETDARMSDGTTPLKAAAQAGRIAVVRMLLDAGAAVDARNENGATALVDAAFAGHVLILHQLREAGADLNAKLKDGSTALMAAAVAGHDDVVRLLIEWGADVNATARNGATALNEAAYPGHDSIIRLLLAAGSDVNGGRDRGWTALTGAVVGGHLELVRVLLAAGADVTARDQRGWTAVMHAAAAVNVPLVKLLVASDQRLSAGERHMLLGATYANQYYSTNEARLLDLAAAEFDGAVTESPSNVVALEWRAAVGVLRWAKRVDLDQFQSAQLFLDKCADLDPNTSLHHYWIAATTWMFLSRTPELGAALRTRILDRGIKHAGRAVELSPSDADATRFLALLYQAKAEHASTRLDRHRLSQLAERAAQKAADLRDRVGEPTFDRGEMFRPVPPPAPWSTVSSDFPYGAPRESPAEFPPR